MRNVFYHRKKIGIFLAVLLLLMTACGEKQAEMEPDIQTQKKTEDGRTQITVLVKYAFTINAFEKAVEKEFPDIDLVQVGNYTSDRGLVEYERRLEHDDLPDMVMTWPLEIGEEYWDDRLMDLSGMPFTSRYNTSMLDKISKDGKLYYLPGPAQVRGIVYNKTMFEENGWQVPRNYNEFIALCQQIEQSGIRAIQLGFQNPEVLDTAFVGYSFGNCFSKPEDAQWLEDYNNGKGSFGDQFGPALDTFQQMRDAGIWKPGDLNVDYAEREKMMFSRKCAMVEDSVLMTRMGYQTTGSTDEFALMPFFDPDGDDWARLYMVCYIGLNKHLEEAANKEKYDLVMELMEYISSTEGQDALAADTGAMYSSLNNVAPPDVKEIQDLRESLARGRYAIFPELANAQNALREGLAGILEGKLTKEDVLRMVDAENAAQRTVKEEAVIGTASKDFTMIETGNFITDTMREKSGADIALFMDNGKDGRYNGKGVSGKLYKGNLTESDVIRILPDLKHNERGVLQVVTMTGADLVNTLEHSIPVDNNNTGWFYYFSGLRVEYDPVAKPGSRILKITDSDGEKLDMEKMYSVAVMDETVPKEYIRTSEETGITMSELLINQIKKSEEISPSGDGRFTLPKTK